VRPDASRALGEEEGNRALDCPFAGSASACAAGLAALRNAETLPSPELACELVATLASDKSRLDLTCFDLAGDWMARFAVGAPDRSASTAGVVVALDDAIPIPTLPFPRNDGESER